MGERQRHCGRLTEEQKRLVHDNVGLVAVHLRRRVADLSRPRHDREYDDLLQEGCLGLMQAAVRYRPERGIPFAAYALPRIHNAISRALSRRFATVYVPPIPASRRLRTRTSVTGPDGAGDRDRPRVLPLTEEADRQVSARRFRGVEADSARAADETIGQRLGEIYERAVRAAGESAGTAASARGDRNKLTQLLVEERLLVPDEESRRSLRQIARDTRSSFARVTRCGQQLSETVRDLLETDPEFRELRRRARASPAGPATPVDEEIERELAEVNARELARRYRHAEPSAGARMLHDVLKASQTDIEGMIHDCFSRLSKPAQRQLLENTTELRGAGARANPGGRAGKAG